MLLHRQEMIIHQKGFLKSPDLDAAPNWTLPPLNMIKINIDAAISARSNLSVVSGVCRDASGAVLRWGVSILRGILKVEVAEAKAVPFGIQQASEVPSKVLFVESDAANFISRLLHPESAIDPIHVIIDDCLAETASRTVQFQHVRRHCNQVAHASAK
ncbi:uncharacterized protein LOC126678398 [Mercurialis annua]|uniref:uncharacterized protein LOC126678398 n=1 Tax=Mercurialis annua TaxID=3986 RepID=UPI00215E9FC8|nr:uncharacterized protein LOC126678398 [Mercurialis annua]